MSDPQATSASTRAGVIAALGEFIEALDRRVAHMERVGEIKIAKDAERLRNEAVNRIKELKRPGHDIHDPELVNAIMTDDGGPARKASERE